MIIQCYCRWHLRIRFTSHRGHWVWVKILSCKDTFKLVGQCLSFILIICKKFELPCCLSYGDGYNTRRIYCLQSPLSFTYWRCEFLISLSTCLLTSRNFFPVRILSWGPSFVYNFSLSCYRAFSLKLWRPWWSRFSIDYFMRHSFRDSLTDVLTEPAPIVFNRTVVRVAVKIVRLKISCFDLKFLCVNLRP